ncbi:MAG: TIGR03790 family protein [Bryobacteraceae bacterium]
MRSGRARVELGVGAALIVCLLPTQALPAGPENVALIINDASAISRSIGEYYARRRAIPVSNVCHVRVSEGEDVGRSEYSSNIAGAVARCLQKQRLTEKVLYLVTTAGLPLRVSGASGRDGEVAAVDSELALLYAEMHGMKHPVKGSVPNPFFGQRESAFEHPRFPMYLVTRLAGYDFAAARALVDRSIEAQDPKYRGKGKIVIDLKLLDSTSGNEWLRDASLRVPQDRLVFDESATVLYDLKDVVAYASWGSNDPSRKRRKIGFRWLPGAIMTEFVSTNGRTFKRPPETWTIGSWSEPKTWWAGAPQTLSADYVDEGVTGASGHVSEPYLAFCPRPDILIPAYIGGRNLAESYYLAIPRLSWQNIVLGDPLCKLP